MSGCTNIRWGEVCKQCDYCITKAHRIRVEKKLDAILAALNAIRDDNPEWTEADFARAKPASEVLGAEAAAAFVRCDGHDWKNEGNTQTCRKCGMMIGWGDRVAIRPVSL